jgi:hypothetical protein
VRGGPSSEAGLARGGAQPSSEADLARGGALVGCGGHQGRGRVACALWARGLVCVLRSFMRRGGFSPVV